MKTMTRKTFGLLALLVALVVTAGGVLYAQHSRGGMMGMMSMMRDCPMMQAMHQSPAAVLQQQKELGLSAAQVKQLQELKESSHPSHMQMMQQMQALHQQIRQATSGDQFNEAAVRAVFDRMGSLHTEMGVAMMRAQHQAGQVLTPAQREKFSKMGGGMMGMHGMMQGGMDMETCPMMKGGSHGSMQHQKQN
jgi:Spy/CpxP family protein refolding chaperone